ncbi:hypothetical protein [Rickettsiella endosymbiont of Rhagonycha lignosa]|uniref:hypothetical protein n=1 Tax=Rickettsiella endosymbiont of Rhagonycha lignosa TaxID=3077937 RepID=UPI00313CC058
MKKILFSLIVSFLLCVSNNVLAIQTLPKLFLFVGSDANLRSYEKILLNPCITGIQAIYTWKELEPKKGIYNFSRIERDLGFLNSIHKKLFIQLQDRSFQPNIFNVPDYIRKEKIYHNGVAMQYDFPGEGIPITEGWVARVWDPAVRERFQLLIQKLATQFDGKIYGINLPETATDFNSKNPPKDFTQDRYFNAELENINALRSAFTKSIVLQYVNFFPGEWNNDHKYMSRLFSYAIQHRVGLGGPDIVPYRKAQMKNSYPFFHQKKNKLNNIGMAVQEGEYTYKKTDNTYYNFSDFYLFAKDYLGATIIFWNTKEPFFSKELLPKINDQYFDCGK